MGNLIHHTGPVPMKGKVRFKLNAVIRQFIKAAENGEIINYNGDKFAKGGIRIYRTSLLWVEKYIDKFGPVYLDMVTPIWTEYFSVFLMENDMSKSSIATNLSRIKTIMNRAFRAGICMNSGYGIRILSERTSQVYNTLEELKDILDTDFEFSGKNMVRDIYIMHCFLGMRMSDYRRFLNDPLKFIRKRENQYFVEYISKKTNTLAILPLGYIPRKILFRNNFSFGKKIFSLQHYNKYIKIIAKEAGINETVVFNITKGGDKMEIVKKKNEMMSSHTARRTFASLLELMEMPRPQIMKMTGHTTEQSFMGYVRISQLDNALKVKNHEFFKIKL